MPTFALPVHLPGFRACTEHIPHDHPTLGLCCGRCLAVLRAYQPSHQMCHTHNQRVVRSLVVALVEPAATRDDMTPSLLEATAAAYRLSEQEARRQLDAALITPPSMLAITRNGKLDAWRDEHGQWRRPATTKHPDGARVDAMIYQLVFACEQLGSQG